MFHRHHLLVAGVICFGFLIAQLTAIEEQHWGNSLRSDDGRVPSESDGASNAKDRALLRASNGGHQWYYKNGTKSVFSSGTVVKGQSRNDDSNNKFMTSLQHIQEKTETNRAHDIFSMLERNKKDNAAASKNNRKRGKGKGSSSKSSKRSSKEGKGKGSRSSKQGSTLSKSKSSKSKGTGGSVSSPIQTRRVENVFLSYVLPVTTRTMPSDADYAELAEATADWFEQAVRKFVPPFMFLLTVESKLDYAEYGAGIPEPRFNVLLVFDFFEYAYYVTNNAPGNAPSAAMIFEIMWDSINVDYILKVVRAIPAFADVTEVVFDALFPTLMPSPFPSSETPSPEPATATPSPAPTSAVPSSFVPSFNTATPSPAPTSAVPSSFGPSFNTANPSPAPPSEVPSSVGPSFVPSSLLPSFSDAPSALASSDMAFCSSLADGPFTFALETKTVFTENLALKVKPAILAATEAFLLANVGFPAKSWVLEYVDDFLEEPPQLDASSKEILIEFTAGVSLKCGADSGPEIPPFFVAALESDAFLQALAPVLVGTPAEPTTSVTLVTPPFLDGFGRL